MVEYDKRTCHYADAKNGCTFYDCDDCKYFYNDYEMDERGIDMETKVYPYEECEKCDKREKISNNVSVCPSMEIRCVKQLEEHDKQIRADVFKDCILENDEYCWQRCVAIEHCQECRCLGNGDINYFC